MHSLQDNRLHSLKDNRLQRLRQEVAETETTLQNLRHVAETVTRFIETKGCRD